MKLFIVLILSTSYLLGEEGCSIYKKSVSKEMHVEIEKHEPKRETAFFNITPTLKRLSVVHDGEEIVIQRKVQEAVSECPPFCIQPISIEGVKTVGEVETLAFLESVKEKKEGLLLDVRENLAYQEGTIPGSINLPLSMFNEKSPYYQKVLLLLGAKQNNKKWYFKNVQRLLIYGTSAIHDEASTMIKRLVNLGYPKEKLRYYRGGIESWKRAGLTIY
ncbi:MAG TPA: hypothetical protein ENK82_01695 [Campylobacterales bacterium]|nr:hypothetical protein [Campylobacterales bacterium]HHS92035.1 hypothetical protein [Campylobacterales bacterium]